MSDATIHDPNRPWPPPRRPWVAEQTWAHLLLGHWPVAAEALRAVVPAAFEVDTFAGQGWVSVVPFLLEAGRLRGLPRLPGMRSPAAELNVRTYVTRDGKPGVSFFSIDLGNRGAAALARTLFHAPYYHAQMSLTDYGEDVTLVSERQSGGAPPSAFRVRGRPFGPVEPATPGSLDAWLANRYCLYLLAFGGRPVQIEIDHAPWQLQPAEAAFDVSTLALPAGVRLDGPPALVHYVRRIVARVWPPEVLR